MTSRTIQSSIRLKRSILQVKCERIARSLGKTHLMNPHPDVAKYERQGYKEQPHVGVARASVNPSLPSLAITCLDAEAFPVTLADVGGIAVDPPGGEKQLLTFFLAGFCGPGNGGSRRKPRNVTFCFPLFMVCEYQPAGCRLRARRPVSLLPFLGRRPANFTGIRNGRFSCCIHCITATLKNARSSSKYLIFRPISRIRASSRRRTVTIESWRRTQVKATV